MVSDRLYFEVWGQRLTPRTIPASLQMTQANHGCGDQKRYYHYRIFDRGGGNSNLVGFVLGMWVEVFSQNGRLLRLSNHVAK